MKNFIFIIILLITIFLVTKIGAIDISVNERIFFIEERMVLKNLPKDISNLCVWIPYPVSDDWQTTEDFKLIGPFKETLITDKEYGNKVLFLKPKQSVQDESTSEIVLSFRAKRKECSLSSAPGYPYRTLSRFLKADRLVPVNGEIKKIAKKITQGKSGDLEKVRAIYDYVIDELTYAKDDPKVCGIGDSLLTLEYKKGICTDYHSLFISFVRSLGIPAKFEIGFRIPEGENEGVLNGYHCWAKFYLKDKGWIPVDISEADKHPEKRDYFFGHIDENRIHFTTGRDIGLKYAKDKDALPLNFLIYPYIELDGKQVKVVDFEITFKELRGGDRYGKLLRFREGKAGEI